MIVIYILLCISLLWLLTVNFRVRSTFKRYSKIRVSSGLTGAEAAERILSQGDANGVMVRRCQGNLTDHYDPKTNCLYLSEDVYESSSISAVSVAAHEAGHAIQDSEEYLPMRLRSFIVPSVNFASKLAMPLILIGFILEYLLYVTDFGYYVVIAGLVLYSLYTIFALITLPVEFNASRRAMKLLSETGVMEDGSEQKKGKKVLRAAAMTYVASFAISLLQLLRLIAIFGRRRR